MDNSLPYNAEHGRVRGIVNVEKSKHILDTEQRDKRSVDHTQRESGRQGGQTYLWLTGQLITFHFPLPV